MRGFIKTNRLPVKQKNVWKKINLIFTNLITAIILTVVTYYLESHIYLFNYDLSKYHNPSN